mmetsp:Transcript_164785/g.528681  ORF Transcript_164785/g.528681 Transcript_164785/m.528681 type:complete len:286 (-) Transcript_164785:1540-2397(-)
MGRRGARARRRWQGIRSLAVRRTPAHPAGLAGALEAGSTARRASTVQCHRRQSRRAVAAAAGAAAPGAHRPPPARGPGTEVQGPGAGVHGICGRRRMAPAAGRGKARCRGQRRRPQGFSRTSSGAASAEANLEGHAFQGSAEASPRRPSGVAAPAASLRRVGRGRRVRAGRGHGGWRGLGALALARPGSALEAAADRPLADGIVLLGGATVAEGTEAAADAAARRLAAIRCAAAARRSAARAGRAAAGLGGLGRWAAGAGADDELGRARFSGGLGGGGAVGRGGR